jgi:hypothetical protein
MTRARIASVTLWALSLLYIIYKILGCYSGFEISQINLHHFKSAFKSSLQNIRIIFHVHFVGHAQTMLHVTSFMFSHHFLTLQTPMH